MPSKCAWSQPQPHEALVFCLLPVFAHVLSSTHQQKARTCDTTIGCHCGACAQAGQAWKTGHVASRHRVSKALRTCLLSCDVRCSDT